MGEDWGGIPLDKSDWGGIPIAGASKSDQPAGMDTALYEGALQGASANWRDEIYGASKASGLPDWLGGYRAPVGAARLAYEHATGTPGPASEEYERATKEIRERIERLRKENPLAFGAGEIGGGAGSMLLTRGAGPAAGAIGRIGQAVKQGGIYGLLSGAGAGEGVEGKIIGAGVGTATGAGLGLVGSGAAEVLSPITRRIGNAVRGWYDPESEASRRVAEHLTADWKREGPSLSAEEIAALNAAGTPRAVIDAGGESTRALARSAANTSPEARAALTEMAHDRFETQSPRIAQYIRDITGGANAGADRETLERMAQQINRPAYKTAYAAGENGIWTPGLERLSGSPAVRHAMESAVDRGRDRAIADGYGAFNPGVTFENGIMQFGKGKGAPPYPNLQFWDYVQRELRDTETAATRAGRREEAGTAIGLRRNLLGELDNAVPEFAKARSGAAQFFGADNALDAGQQFVRSTADIGEARRAIARMSQPERELFARGYASNLSDAVERSGNNRNVLNATFFNNPAAKQRTELALGPQRAQQLEALLRAESILDRARTALGNSTTVRQWVEMGLAGGATAGAEGLLNQNFDLSHIFTAAILTGAARRGAQVIDQRVARRVGEMLASGDPAVLARGVQVAARNPAILNALRQATGRLVRGATAVAEPAEKSHGAFKQGGPVKSTKQSVHYRIGKGDRRCGNCTMFRPPHGCTAVQGSINPKWLCDLFERGHSGFASGGSVKGPHPLARLAPDGHHYLPDRNRPGKYLRILHP